MGEWAGAPGEEAPDETLFWKQRSVRGVTYVSLYSLTLIQRSSPPSFIYNKNKRSVPISHIRGAQLRLRASRARAVAPRVSPPGVPCGLNPVVNLKRCSTK